MCARRDRGPLRPGHDRRGGARFCATSCLDLRVVFTGRGSNEDETRQLIEEQDLEDIVRFEGFVSRERLNDLLHAADVGHRRAEGLALLAPRTHVQDGRLLDLRPAGDREPPATPTSELYDDDVLEYFEPGDAADLARAIRASARRPDAGARSWRATGGSPQARHGWAVQQEIYLGVYDALLRGRGSVRAVEAEAGAHP